MALTSGQRLGSYEVLGSLGAGGMGEVYRARDTKLQRDVAIKVLPESLATDRDRLARFEREAQLLAALNHPHIAAIYGVDTVADTQFLVLELVDGETLADRIARGGALPISEAVAIAKQIAEALQAAHDKGIIHRDLKPANIALTADGHVKVLDFGLAKAFEAGTATSSAGVSRNDATSSPTITSLGTVAGILERTALEALLTDLEQATAGGVGQPGGEDVVVGGGCLGRCSGIEGHRATLLRAPRKGSRPLARTGRSA